MRRTARSGLVVVAALVAAALGGCGSGVGAPGHGASRARRGGAAGAALQSTPAAVQRTHEYPTPAPSETVLGGWRTPVQAVAVFAQTYINWTAATVAPRLRALAQVSLGQARSALTLAAGEAVNDYELRRGEIANSGVVEAIAPLRGGRAGEYVVVTRERTSAANSSAYSGLMPEWHVALAGVTPVAGGLWVLSEWQPEN